MHHSSIVDECYMTIGAYLDPNLCDKIKRGDYVDFARLLPREKASNFQDDKLELIYRNGQTFFVPARDRDITGIANFNRWEQAFRVYSNVYLKEHPDRAAELIQYNHIIFSASSTFVWDNVYQYDKEFSMHLSSFPERSWGIILQQAWSMCLKDRLYHHGSNKQQHNGSKGKKEICQRFNKGLCTAGRNCKYDHRCLGCGKFGHGIHICRNRKTNGSNEVDEVQSSGSTTASKN